MKVSVSSSFKTFFTILCSLGAHQAFKDFLKHEYSDENINFWTDVEKYKKLKDCKDRMKMADQIFCTYLQTEAVYEVRR